MSSEMTQVVNRKLAANTYDMVIAELIWMYQYIKHIEGSIKIIHAHNYEVSTMKRYLKSTQNPLSMAYAIIEYLKLIIYEKRVYCDADFVWVLSDDDRRGIARLTNGRARLESIHFTIDMDYWVPTKESYDPKVITFLGSMSYPPNVDGALWFCRRIFPIILQDIPDARLYLVGMAPHAKLRNLHDNERIVVTGYVNDVRPYLKRSAVSVVPLRYGGGVKTKVVVALSMGVPVVSTTTGGEGIPARNGDDLIIEDDPSMFAAAVVKVMTNRNLRARLSLRSRQFAEEHYRRDNLVAEVDHAFKRICERGNESARLLSSYK
jgi:glycosyltransferase involved in cell wall biosynthesis